MTQRMQQDYGQWYQLPFNDGPSEILTYECRWIFQLAENAPNGPITYWRLRWRPSKPRVCYYVDTNGRTPFACRSPYDPFYDSSPISQINQFFININNIDNNFNTSGSFNTNNSTSPPTLGPTQDGGVGFVPNGNQINTPTTTPTTPQPPADQSGSALKINGLVFSLFLNHQQVQTIVATGQIAASVIPNPIVMAAILAATGFLDAMDQAGGNNGVDISGVIGDPQLIITPHGVFNIFKVVQVVQGVAQQIADQTSAAAANAFQAISNAAAAATDAANQAKNNIENFFSSL